MLGHDPLDRLHADRAAATDERTPMKEVIRGRSEDATLDLAPALALALIRSALPGARVSRERERERERE
jgi:hypothetical protein